MTAATDEAMLLRTAMEAAARGGKPDESYTRAVEAGVATLFPSEARRFVEALEVLLAAAQRVAEAQETLSPIAAAFIQSAYGKRDELIEPAHSFDFRLQDGDTKGIGSCGCGWDTGFGGRSDWLTEIDAEDRFNRHVDGE